MPAATPQEAATKWEQNTQSGVAKYRAKLQQMYQNYAAGLQRFWRVAPGPATTEAYQPGLTSRRPSAWGLTPRARARSGSPTPRPESSDRRPDPPGLTNHDGEGRAFPIMVS
jgi:hypothetical protein